MMAKALRCSNCTFSSLELLNSIDSSETRAVTSDAQLISNFQAIRTLCNKCACIEIHYTPGETLNRYFKEQYDISDAVQDNLIVYNNKKLGKHTHIINTLFPQLGNLSESGSFLEIACGTGKLTNLFLERHPEWECFGIDPSIKSPGKAKNQSGKVTFIQDYFKESYFQGMTFDLIVAHGFLNRSPVLSELLKIRNLSRKGTLLSLELLVLENSTFVPYIWDHSFMYKMDVFEKYLEHVGFAPVSKTCCVSSYHYLCRCEEEPKPINTLIINSNTIKETNNLYNNHVEWWNKVKENYENIISRNINKKQEYALFGAGLYNAVFLNLLRENKFKFVIDDVKVKTNFFGIPVINLKDAIHINDCQVLICTRPSYVKSIVEELRENNILYSLLNPLLHI